MRDLYQYIEEWEGKEFYEDFRTLVDLTYELQSLYKKSKIRLYDPIEESVRLSFFGLKIAIKDFKKMYCPGTTVEETTNSIFKLLVMRERFLDYKLQKIA